MKTLKFLTIFFLPWFLVQPAHAQGMAVLELFTAQGCFTAPPGDKVFEQILSENPTNLITYSCHTTFFNEKATTDSLSRKFCDTRHEDYFLNLDLWTLYTPQFIINGYYDVRSPDEEMIKSGVKMAQSFNTVKPVSLSLNDETLSITLPEITPPEEDAIDIILIGYKDNEEVTIQGGPNIGRTIPKAGFDP